MLILLLAIAFLLDRAAVCKYKLSKVAYIEIAGIVVLLIYIFWSSRSTKLFVKTEHDHFVVIYRDGGKTIDDFAYAFPFDKELVIDNQECIVLDKKLRQERNVEIIPDDWMGYSIESKEIYLKSGVGKVHIYWTGNPEADTDKYLTCTESL